MKTFVVFKNSVGTRREICSSRCQSLFRLVFGGTDSFFLNHFELKRPQSQHWLWVHSLLRFHFNAYQLSVSLLHNCFTEINALQSLMGFTAFLFLIFHQLYHGLRWRWNKKIHYENQKDIFVEWTQGENVIDDFLTFIQRWASTSQKINILCVWFYTLKETLSCQVGQSMICFWPLTVHRYHRSAAGLGSDVVGNERFWHHKDTR